MRMARWTLGTLGLALVLLSAWQIHTATQGLEEVHASTDGMPVVIVGPAGATDASRPLVLVGHGLAGSDRIMRGFAYTFARAGYVAALWDFRGHGANPNPMAVGYQDNILVADAEAALAEAKRLGLTDGSRVAIVGHSMGSGVALSFGQKYPGTAATIAVSPVGTAVTPSLPRNLLLMAGSLEPGFVANAERRLSEAGGPGGDIAKGTARRLQIIPNVEHISILFSPLAHATALQWLDATFGAQPGAAPYTDVRIAWFGLGVLGTLLAAATLVPRFPTAALWSATAAGAGRPLWWRAVSLTAGALAATLTLWVAGLAGVNVSGLLGLRVGGYLLLWFATAGIVALLFLAVRVPLPSLQDLMAGLLIFAALWLGVGLLGDAVWLPWLLIPKRLVLWPVGILALLPWCWAVGQVSGTGSGWSRIGWWLLQSFLLYATLTLAVRLTPELGFLSLILPVFPAVLLLHAVPNAPQRGAWPFTVSGALLVSWMVLAVFPLQ